jgi:hypothetical protein
MTPQDPTALGAPMPTMPDAPPDPFGGMIQAIAAGFAAGFGGKTVADQIAQQRQNSWEAWQRKQDATLRREELDRADRRFAASLDMQRTQLEETRSANERAAQDRKDAATAEQSRFDMTFNAAKDERAARDRADTMKQAGLADFAVREGLLPEDTLFADRLSWKWRNAIGRMRRRTVALKPRASTRTTSKPVASSPKKTRWPSTFGARCAPKTPTCGTSTVNSARSRWNWRGKDVAAGRSNSFEGSIEAYLKLFGRAETQARGGSGEVRAALDAIKGGDFSRLDELRAIPAPAAESRPTTVAESRPTEKRDTVKPPAGASITTKRKEAATTAKNEGERRIQSDRLRSVVASLDSIPDNVISAIEAKLGGTPDEQAVVSELLKHWDEASKKANASRFRTVAGPSAIALEAAKIAAGL